MKRQISDRGILISWRALAATCITVGAWCGAAQAQTVAYWRMEADIDGATAGAQVANEVAGGSILTGASLSVAPPVPGSAIFDPFGAAVLLNVNAADGNVDVNATAASYAALNVSSITAEGFFRTTEGTATFLARNSGTTGFVISQPNDVIATYYVGGVLQTVKGGTGGIAGGAVNLDAPYVHIAFTYDSTTGIANLYADGILRGTNTTLGGGALFSATDAINVNVGGGTFGGAPATGGYDGGGQQGAGGVIDEIRISGAALTPGQFLQAVPEPSGPVLLTICGRHWPAPSSRPAARRSAIALGLQ